MNPPDIPLGGIAIVVYVFVVIVYEFSAIYETTEQVYEFVVIYEITRQVLNPPSFMKSSDEFMNLSNASHGGIIDAVYEVFAAVYESVFMVSSFFKAWSMEDLSDL
ncbi:hypothetical protein L6452_05571 [Arctium lappa]|uniref:Uncharacterized protein n=1 Tax=Arctium lappa TaxID=4217 RepID=A0ACB9EGH2_ARCLA|nr:hypothetical protein L6452_05571 [Arctium lappa]